MKSPKITPVERLTLKEARAKLREMESDLQHIVVSGDVRAKIKMLRAIREHCAKHNLIRNP